MAAVSLMLLTFSKYTMPLLGHLSTHKKALVQTGFLILLYTISRLVNSLTSLVLAYHFGASISVSQVAVFVLLMTVIPAVVAAAVPLIVSKELAIAENKEQALLVCRSWGVEVSRGVMAGYLLLIVPFAWLLAPEPTQAARLDLGILLLLGFPTIALAVPVVIERTILQVSKRLYITPLYRTVALGCTVVAAMLSGKFGGIYLCAVGTAVGSLVEFQGLRRLSPYKKYFDLNGLPAIPWKAVGAVTCNNAAMVTCDLIDQALAAKLGHGTQAIYVLCLSLTAFICTTLYGVSNVLATVYLPSLFTKGRLALWLGGIRLYGAIVLFTVLVYAGVSLNASWLAQHLFNYGSFNPEDTSKIAGLLPWLSVPYLLIPAMAILVCSTGLAGGNRAITWAALAYFSTRAGIELMSYQDWGLHGIALASISASVVQAVILLFWLRSTSVERELSPVAVIPNS